MLMSIFERDERGAAKSTDVASHNRESEPDGIFVLNKESMCCGDNLANTDVR